MQNPRYNQPRLKKWLRGKGFYVALAVCLLGAGLASWALIQNAVQSGDPQSQINQEVPSWDSSDTEVVEKPVTSQPKSSSAASNSQSTSSSQGQDSSSSSASAGQQSEPASQQTASNGVFVSPISGETVNPFSDGKVIKDQTLGDWRTHNGIDIKAEAGAQVKACQNGKVTSVRDDDIWGTVVEIQFEGGATGIYKSLSQKVTVKEGQTLKSGDVIGTVAQSIPGESKLGTHLHFELKKDGAYVDPAAYFSK
ncbi:Peptidase family M23 [Bittarella massiliensis (ex Durand et al. 2017)]|nr:Peptidase family M23 [Bittarella massiliensis (ex Durand et al. 2017)]